MLIGTCAAKTDDAQGVCLALAEVAPEVPLLMDTNERQQAVAAIVNACIGSGESWVAIDDGGQIVGFLLAEPNKIERFLGDNDAIHLAYIGVAKSHRGRGIFRALIRHAMDRCAPLTAVVKMGNQSGMAKRLLGMNFHCTATNLERQESAFMWRPTSPDS